MMLIGKTLLIRLIMGILGYIITISSHFVQYSPELIIENINHTFEENSALDQCMEGPKL